jgi:hypothetical protein
MCLKLRFRLVNTDPQHFAFEIKYTLPQDKSRVRTTRGCAEDDPVYAALQTSEFLKNSEV